MASSPTVLRFVADWSERVDPVDFARGHDISQVELCHILLADQHLCWKNQQPRPIEFYIEHWPNSHRTDELFLRLFVDEFGYREQAGVHESEERFAARFPDLDLSLRNQLIGVLCAESNIDTVGSRLVPGRSSVTKQSPDDSVRSPMPLAGGSRKLGTGGVTKPAALPSLPQFQVLEKLGEGAFGVVYRALDLELDRIVAVKVLRIGPCSSNASVDGLIDEARKLAKVEHPGIVPVYQVGRAGDGTAFMVSKFIAGGDLRNRIKQGTLSEREAATLIRDCADALDRAHQLGLVHRDIKSANILIDEDRRPWIADFGLASFDDELHSQADEVTGTPAYMSPEQVRGDSQMLDGRTDIWSLGVILYEVLVGRLPFRGSSVPEVFAQIERRQPTPIRMKRRDVSMALEQICLRCLAKRVEDRYQTAGDLVEDLNTRIVSLRGDCQATGESRDTDEPLVIRVAGSPYVYVPDTRFDRFTIGRQRRRPGATKGGCDFVIRCLQEDDKSLQISRTHLEVIRDQGAEFIVDHSKLGTSLNGQRLNKETPTSIRPGDRLEIAGVLTLEVLSRTQAALGPRVATGRVVCSGPEPADFLLEASLGELTTVDPADAPP